MSENNKPELMTAEVVAPYDFEFITHALGLIPYHAIGLDEQPDYQGAFSAGAVVNIEICEEDGNIALTLYSGFEIVMRPDQFAQVEQRLKGILKAQQPMIIGVPPQGKRFQQ